MAIELYAPQVECGNVMTADDIDRTEYEFYGDYETIEDAMEAAETAGCGIWLTSTEDRGEYTGKITVVQGARPSYESI